MSRPTNVRIVRADGTELPCELVHLGIDVYGMDQWAATGDYHPERGDTITVGTLPGRTGIRWGGLKR